jgi:rhamnulose-1-phosphate aldolase/alcohol dehydrogenase
VTGTEPLAGTAPFAPLVESLWDAADVPNGDLAQLTYASNRLGADRSVSNFGGGNTSVKTRDVDHLGRESEVLWVKGSGCDLATMRPRDFTGLRLGEILPLFERSSMSDEEMVAYLARCQVTPDQPRASIETLLHAFVPHPHVHHTHPDAINMICGAANGEQLARECFGDEAAWIPYVRPGFTLARQVGEAVRNDGRVRYVLLAKHGLVASGKTAEEAYESTIEAINRAAELVSAVARGPRFGGRAVEPPDRERRESLLAEVLPAIRGAVSSERPKILQVDTSDIALEFVASRDAAALSQVGAACPDHLVHTKRLPMWVDFDPAREDAEVLIERVRSVAATFRDDYRGYVEEFASEGEVSHDPDPRVVLIAGLGLVTVGANLKGACLARDLYHRAMRVMGGAAALGGFVSLTAEESYAIEYWPLELYKLSLARAPGALEGRVAFITGGAGGIGRAVAAAMARDGACIVAADIDAQGATAAAEEFGDAGVAVTVDVTQERAVQAAYRDAALAFGGVDIVVSNAGLASSAPIAETTAEMWDLNHSVLARGYFLVAREAFRLLQRQSTGGSVIFVASKNAIVAGPNAAAYSSAKAAELHLARCLAEEGGPHGIRVNTVNPDAVLQGSRIWGSSWRQERADAYGIEPEALEEHYRKRTTLKVSIGPEDIAEAVLFFASPDRSSKTTGNMLNVDGGVPAAYPR